VRSILLNNEKRERNAGWGLARLFIVGMLCLHAVFFRSLWQRIEAGYPDFAVYYTAATILREGLGHQLYVGHVQSDVQKGFTGELPTRLGPLPYIHPPTEALIFVPLTWLPFREAFVLWDLLNIAMLFGVALLLRSEVGALRLIPPWEFVLGSIAFFPVFESLLQGQDSILQLLFCVLAWRAIEKKADVLAGCWFALGAFKFQLMIPIVLLFVIWKHRRVLIGFAAISVVLVLISVGLVGWQGLLHYPIFVLQIANMPSMGGVPPDFLPNLHGLIMGWPLHLSGMTEISAVAVSSIGLFIFVAKKGGKAFGPGKSGLQFLLAIAVADLIGWQTNIHDYSLLVLPLVLIADYCLRTAPQKPGSRFALLYPAVPILISPLWLILWLSVGHMNLMAIPLLWWVWKIGGEMPQPTKMEISVQPQS
jgi:Glycosyltransferase family 87